MKVLDDAQNAAWRMSIRETECAKAKDAAQARTSWALGLPRALSFYDHLPNPSRLEATEISLW